ncbi:MULTISPECIES: helix-turn-helix transcriptional regulator [Bacillus cereus group]|uniref:helix-turn-helix transcriptional regulator n=1 Tax=Bacillus cereus group TaxID=86661 RepID=UPI0018CDA03B|nr:MULTISPECIES: helix-turn-helix transcriptional regulator [Bacillus cereus group]MBG9838389.1 phage-related Cro-like protein [Bacillus tropicus]MBG9879689.1 phage-related Cro-like protein [Bacillus tropicus]MBG9922237.1 phage-related Cro-like protein [Bacillus tropicus]MBJ8356028.1 transcriptional regulator [Bacillus mycoides]MED2903914.1 helix-turn-helix transcriptional regulator [Bacillus tropicus]
MILTIRQARLVKGITQRDVAKKLNVHVQTYRKMEEHPDNITIGDAKIICDYLGMSYDQIFFNYNSTLSGVNDKSVST